MFTFPGCPTINPYVRVLIFYVSTLCLVQATGTTGKPHLPSRCPSPPRNPGAQIPVLCPQIPGVPRSQIDLKRRLRWETSCSKCCRWGDCEFCNVLGVYRRCLSVFARIASKHIPWFCTWVNLVFFYVNLGLFLFSAWTTDIRKLLLHFDSEQTILFRDHF